MEGDAWTAPGGDYDKVNIESMTQTPLFVMVSASWLILPPAVQNVK